MSLISEILIIILLFAAYGLIHSFLASTGFKEFLVTKIGNKIAFYRLCYNIFALLSLIFIYDISPKPNDIIFDLKFPFDIVIVSLQLCAFIGIIWTFKYICFKEFIGINQIKRYFNNNYNHKTLDEEMTLRIEGPYKFSRHPIYLFSILFLLFRPVIDLFYLVFVINIILYFYIGAIFEEKKLVKMFGEEYKEYQKNVSRIFPLKILKRS